MLDIDDEVETFSLPSTVTEKTFVEKVRLKLVDKKQRGTWTRCLYIDSFLVKKNRYKGQCFIIFILCGKENILIQCISFGHSPVKNSTICIALWKTFITNEPNQVVKAIKDFVIDKK